MVLSLNIYANDIEDVAVLCQCEKHDEALITLQGPVVGFGNFIEAAEMNAQKVCNDSVGFSPARGAYEARGIISGCSVVNIINAN